MSLEEMTQHAVYSPARSGRDESDKGMLAYTLPVKTSLQNSLFETRTGCGIRMHKEHTEHTVLSRVVRHTSSNTMEKGCYIHTHTHKESRS